MARRVELLSGFLAPLAGIVGLAYTLLGPAVATETAIATPEGEQTVTRHTESLVESGIEPAAVVFLLAMLFLALGVTAGAYLHAARGVGNGRVAVWVCTTLLVVGVFLSLLSVGAFFLPTAILAIIAAAAAARSPASP